MNAVTLLGNLAKDPEVRKTKNDNAVVSFCIVTSGRYKDKSTNEWVDKAEYHNCVAFAAKADAIGRFFQKGTRIAVQGELQTRTWDDKEGNKRYTTEVVVKDFDFCERKGITKSFDTAQRSGHSPETSQAIDMAIGADDIPF